MNFNKNVINDETAPLLYSERAVFGFSLFASPVFGAVILAMNLRSTEHRRRIPEVVLSALVYTIFVIWLTTWYSTNIKVNNRSGQQFYSIYSNYIANFIGAYLIHSMFWKKFIGADTQYRPRQITIPLIIAIIVIAVSIAASFYSNEWFPGF